MILSSVDYEPETSSFGIFLIYCKARDASLDRLVFRKFFRSLDIPDNSLTTSLIVIRLYD